VPPFALFDSREMKSGAQLRKQCEEWHLSR
jgi:hypothetical protein